MVEDYEELRKRRMEENKRRMEELHLHQLTQALKPPPMKRAQLPKIEAEMVEMRRSIRVANLPARVYKPARVLKQIAFSPWFVKLFLPKVDYEMVIEDENGEIHHVKCSVKKSGLTIGWKKFRVGHNLLDGDVLVFHLVERYKFKVYIVRANDRKKADDLITRLNLEARTKQMTPETDTLSPTPKKTKRSKPVSKPDVPFQELEAFKDFHIMVKGVCIDSKLPDDVEAWDNSLKSFSQLGMKVGFLSERIATRSRLMFESENRLDIERYMEAKTEHKHIEDEIKSFTDELKKLEESSRKIQEDLKHKAGKYEVRFQEEVPYTI